MLMQVPQNVWHSGVRFKLEAKKHLNMELLILRRGKTQVLQLRRFEGADQFHGFAAPPLCQG